jgi:hypothetical protein
MRDKPDALQTLRERESGTARPDEAAAAAASAIAAKTEALPRQKNSPGVTCLRAVCRDVICYPGKRFFPG